jgi:hypothetical protein
MATKHEDVARVVEFRDRLVAFISAVQSRGSGRYGDPRDPIVEQQIRSEQSWLGIEYGRLYNIINRYGVAAAHAPSLGSVSPDVIADAIHSPDHHAYHHVARLTMQHLDTALGRLQADLSEERTGGVAPDRLYQLTSPLYWLGRLVAFLRWVGGTSRGRVTAAIGLVVVAVISGIVSGVAQAWFERLLR